EPLESTAIQVIMKESILLTKYLPVCRDAAASRRLFNRRICEYWDYIRWFLSVHYKFNHRVDTPFWRHCHEATDVSGAEDIVEYFKEGAPLTAKAVPTQYARPTFNSFGYDVLLFGQAVPAQYAVPLQSETDYARHSTRCDRLVASALPQMEALREVARRPE